jgi:hypothetical protein
LSFEARESREGQGNFTTTLQRQTLPLTSIPELSVGILSLFFSDVKVSFVKFGYRPESDIRCASEPTGRLVDRFVG